MHLEAFLFDLMTSEYTQEPVFAKQLLNWLLTEIIGTITFGVLFEVSMHGLFVIHRVSPHQVAENTIQRNLVLPVDLVNLFDLFEGRGDTSMHG